jgi:ribosomal protein L17
MNTGTIKQQTVLRNLLTSLVLHGHVETKVSYARALKAYADSFFSRLVRRAVDLSDGDANRENIREIKSLLFGDVAGKKVMNDLLPTYIATPRSSYVSSVKSGVRSGDAATKVTLTLI